MLNLSSATRVFVALAPVDLRGSFNRLAALTQSVLAQDPLSGHCLVFGFAPNGSSAAASPGREAQALVLACAGRS